MKTNNNYRSQTYWRGLDSNSRSQKETAMQEKTRKKGAGMKMMRPTKRQVAALTLVLVGVVSLMMTDTTTRGRAATSTATQPQNNCLPKIAFESDRDGDYDIYVMNADGRGTPTNLTDNNPASDELPAFSPDGTKVAFTSLRDGNFDVYVMNADGSAQTRLTSDPANDGEPVFSRDGSKIAFTSERNGNGDIYVMDADGNHQNRLTTDPAIDSEPAFSSDGTKIVFRSDRSNNNSDIYVMDADGNNQTRLTTDPSLDIQPSFSLDGSKILFVSDRNNGFEIYVMNADGSGTLTNLTNNPASDIDPSFSPDGSKIAFLSNRDGNNEIYVMDADGNNQTRLTTNPASDEFPAFGGPLDSDGDGVADPCDNCPQTPNPPKIAFTSSNDIYLVNADGTGRTRLTYDPAVDVEPSFSRDGTRIAFVSDRDGNNEIYVINADGTGEARLTNNASDDRDPSFSGDGTKIAFSSGSDIYVMNADGTGRTRLTDNPADDSDPSFSADGTKIAFVSRRDGNDEIYVMNANGTGQARLTNNTAGDDRPSFSPDGTRIAFVSTRDVDFEIYLMNADGSGQTNITNSRGEDFQPSFSPDGTRIAFLSFRHPTGIYVMNADGSGLTNITNSPEVDFEPSFGGQLDSDGDGIGDACENQTPTANAGADQTPECASAPVTLNGSDSTDPNNDPLTYSWKEGDTEIATGVSPTVFLSNGVHTITLTVTDPSNASDTDDVTITVQDTTAPTVILPGDITETLPLNSSATSIVVDFTVTATDNCGTPNVVANPPSGSTFPVGSTTVNVTATDSAGNSATGSFTVTIHYNFAGLFQPVDNPPIVNIAPAGTSIPVKFSLSGNKGLNIFATGSPVSQEITCNNGAQASNVEATVVASNSGLSYDATIDQYTYVWKTDKLWKNRCRQLNLILNDGTLHTAIFQFR